MEPAKREWLKPIIDKVGVPLIWLSIGYLAATIIQRPKRASKAIS